MINPFLSGAGSVGTFSSRAFVPAFAAALLLRFGLTIPALHVLGLAMGVHAGSVPPWFTQNATLWVLGVLAGLEVIAHKNAEARMVLSEVDQWGKPLMAFITQLGLFSVADAQHASALQPLHDPKALLWAGAVGAGTYFVASARNRVVRTIFNADQHDATGAHGLISWAEDAWAIFGTCFTIIFPVIMLALIAILVTILFLFQYWVQRQEEKRKIACVKCATPIYACAISCPVCQTPNPAPRSVGWLGGSTDRPADLAEHPYRLVAKRRCPVCATRLNKRSPVQSCGACGYQVFGEPGFLETYDRKISQKLPMVLVICLLAGFVPIVGLVVGVLYYSTVLVSPYRAYIPLGRSMLMRWSLRVLFLLLFWLQPIPAIGALIVPVMALVNHAAYRSMFRRLENQPRPA